MEFPLKYLIDQQIFLQPNGRETISCFMYQILCGIRHLHKAGIIHRVRNYALDFIVNLNLGLVRKQYCRG